MNFFIYDLISLIIFTLFVVVFLYKKRKNLKKEGILYLYKTKIGIKFIDYVGKKYERLLKVLQYFSITLGYFLMAGILYLLILTIYEYPTKIIKITKAPPIFPLVPYFPRIFGVQEFFPPFYFTYFLLSVLIVATVHEFSHGVFARVHRLKIKSTGFAFLGPFIGAFVEPDEKRMLKKSKTAQLSILSAGVFANIIIALIFFLGLALFFNLTFTEAGATFDMYVPAVIKVKEIKTIDDYNVENLNTKEILNIIGEKKMKEGSDKGLNNLIKITTKERIYLINIEDLKTQLNSIQKEKFSYMEIILL